jgi:hypothetical protein
MRGSIIPLNSTKQKGGGPGNINYEGDKEMEESRRRKMTGWTNKTNLKGRGERRDRDKCTNMIKERKEEGERKVL